MNILIDESENYRSSNSELQSDSIGKTHNVLHSKDSFESRLRFDPFTMSDLFRTKTCSNKYWIMRQTDQVVT